MYDVSTELAPSSNTILRRYMDLSKYLDLLCSKTLYFCQADKFPDRYEGVLTNSMRELQNSLNRRGLSRDRAEDFVLRARLGTYVSCWTYGKSDNMALWQLYGGIKNSVAVTTTVKNLKKCVSIDSDIPIICKVDYIDHHKDPQFPTGNPTTALMYKNKSYFFEREVRILLNKTRQDEPVENLKDNPAYVKLTINPNELIRSVVLAPESEPWFEEIIREVSKKFEMTQPIRNSILSKPIPC